MCIRCLAAVTPWSYGAWRAREKFANSNEPGTKYKRKRVPSRNTARGNAARGYLKELYQSSEVSPVTNTRRAPQGNIIFFYNSFVLKQAEKGRRGPLQVVTYDSFRRIWSKDFSNLLLRKRSYHGSISTLDIHFFGRRVCRVCPLGRAVQQEGSVASRAKPHREEKTTAL